MKCRFCKSNLKHIFIDLNNSPPSNSFLTYEQLGEKETYYPLKLFVCGNCFLVQVDEYKKANEIFNNDYIYFSSYSKSWLEHCKQYTDIVIKRFGLNETSLVTEIASNDGYLLQFFKEENISVLGIEPTKGTAEVARSKGIESITEFFGVALAKKLAGENRKADLLVGNNVLAHVPDVNDFVKGLKIALKEDGVITMEFPHLLKLVKLSQFDTIYHEHFSYLSFTTVVRIFDTHDLAVFDVEEIQTHGGSLRIFAQHKEHKKREIENNVRILLKKESDEGMLKLNFYDNFQNKVKRLKLSVMNFLIDQKMKGYKIAAYGAAAKGNTLLNYFGIKNDLIDFVADASPYKQNKFLPGSHIPVFDEKKIREEKPDYIFILPWNIKDEIIKQLDYVKEWDAKFFISIPELTIIKS